jgi:chromosome segregation ATPase
MKHAVRILKEEGNGEAVAKALGVLNGEIVESEADQTFDVLRSELRASRAARDAALAERAKLEAQVQELEQTARDCAKFQQLLDSQTETVDSQQRQISHLTKEKQRLEHSNADLKKTNAQQAEKFITATAEWQGQLTDAQQRHEQELAEKVAEVREELKAAEARFAEESKQFHKYAKGRFRAQRAKLTLEADRATGLQEELTAASTELNRERADRESAQKEIQRLETVVKDLKKELSTAQVNNRTIAIKLQNSEEQLKRERFQAETRSQITDMGIEAAHQASLNEQKVAFEQKYRELLQSISARFPDIEDFAGTLSEESVEAGLERIASLLQANKTVAEDLDAARAELAGVRRKLGIADDAPVEPAVTVLVKKAGIGWDEWAQRVHALVTNSFSLVKTSEELQFALEEALMGGVRQTQIARRLEMLRFEKKLLVNGRVPLYRSQKKVQPTLVAVISIVAAMRKLLRLTGNLGGGISRVDRDSL